MRRFVMLAGLVAGAWALLRRRGRRRDTVVVGFVDGSEIRLDDGAVRDRLVAAARRAL